jgi:hypothetical protein
MKRLLLAAIIACVATSASARNEDALVACLVGQATTSLQLQYRDKVDAQTATTNAWKYAGKRCKGGHLSEGASDYVHHSIKAKAIEIFGDAPAPEKLSVAGVPAGTYCEVEVADASEGWTYYERGRCPDGSERTTLILKMNGDYILTGLGDEMECKVNPKTYIKAWAEYNCVTYGGRAMKSKRVSKFTTADDQLGLSTSLIK